MGILDRFCKQRTVQLKMPDSVQFESVYSLILALAHMQGIQPEALIASQKTGEFESFRRRFGALQMKDISDMLLEADKQLEDFRQSLRKEKDDTNKPCISKKDRHHFQQTAKSTQNGSKKRNA